MKGKFLVFEGIDGSGTSTQTELLQHALRQQGIKCTTTCEPSDGPVGNLIRQIFKGRIKAPNGSNPDRLGGDLFDEQMAYLFAADRHDHLYNEIDGVYKLIDSGTTVICTRYFFSSIAYHCSSDSDFKFVYDLNKNFPNPDLIIYLDNPTSESLKRIESRKFKDSYENEKKLNQARKNYKKAIENYSGRILQIAANAPINQIHEEILKSTLSLYSEKPE